MIRSFKCGDTQAVFEGNCPAKFATMKDAVERKLTMLHAAVTISDLRSPPGNRLEALAGNRKGQHSIRINRQYRICFRWTDAGPEDVEVVDYH